MGNDYTKTLETLVEQVVAWANDRNLINGSNSVQQGLKLMSEYGELCDSIAKNDLDGIKDGIGDVAVVAIIINAIQANPFAVGYYERNKRYSIENIDTDDDAMGYYICYTFSRELAYMITGRSHVEWIMCCLEVIANHYKLTLTECLQHAYNEIKDRKGVMYKGVFIKESDPRYENAVKELNND